MVWGEVPVCIHPGRNGRLRFGALTPDIAVKGLIAGSSLMFGAFIARRFVLRLEPDIFRLIMDAIMIAAGLAMLWTAATR